MKDTYTIEEIQIAFCSVFRDSGEISFLYEEIGASEKECKDSIDRYFDDLKKALEKTKYATNMKTLEDVTQLLAANNAAQYSQSCDLKAEKIEQKLVNAIREIIAERDEALRKLREVNA